MDGFGRLLRDLGRSHSISMRRTPMNIPKDQIMQLLRQQGHPQADQAEQELPDQVDTDQHAGLLSKFGINPQDLLGKLGGGGGLGGLGGLI
jgi:hypothetical protein